MKIKKFVSKELSRLDDDHFSSSSQTPLKKDAFKIPDIEKIKLIETKIRDILDILGMDLDDDSISGTPKRVARMFINEIFSGINPIIKDEGESQRLAGYGSLNQGYQDIVVREDEAEKANILLNNIIQQLDL